jgi:hypothetical protein
MGGPCSVRGNNPLKPFMDMLDAVWNFTLAVSARDPTPLFEIEDSFSAFEPEQSEAQQPASPKSPYNLRPRQPVNYRV